MIYTLTTHDPPPQVVQPWQKLRSPVSVQMYSTLGLTVPYRFHMNWSCATLSSLLPWPNTGGGSGDNIRAFYLRLTHFIVDYSLANPDTLTKYKTAAQISHKILETVSSKSLPATVNSYQHCEKAGV